MPFVIVVRCGGVVRAVVGPFDSAELAGLYRQMRLDPAADCEIVGLLAPQATPA